MMIDASWLIPLGAVAFCVIIFMVADAIHILIKSITQDGRF